MSNMLYEGGETLSNIESQSNNESGNKISESDMQHVQDLQEKARQVGQQIRTNKQQNNKIALFITHIFKQVNNENIIKYLYDVFFKIKNIEENVTYIRKNINNIVMAGIFIPFYITKAQELKLEDMYGGIYDFNKTKTTIEYYIEYLKKLSQKYHDNIPMDKGLFINFLAEIIIYYDLINTEENSQNTQKSIIDYLDKKLYKS